MVKLNSTDIELFECNKCKELIYCCANCDNCFDMDSDIICYKDDHFCDSRCKSQYIRRRKELK